MNKKVLLLGLLMSTVPVAAETVAPQARLEFFVGSWTIVGEDQYRETCRWTPGNKAVLCETAGGFSIMGYSAVRNSYTHYGFSRDGELEPLYGWIKDDTWHYVGHTQKGAELERIHVTLTPTAAGFRFRQEVSVNAGPWAEQHDFEYVRLNAEAPSPPDD